MTDKVMFDPSKFAKDEFKSAQADQPRKMPGDMAFDPAAFTAKKEAEKEAKKQEALDICERPIGAVKAWSFSTLWKYEECPHSVYLSKVQKAPDPSGPAADRGSRVHKAAEDFIQGYEPKMADELKKFDNLICSVKEKYEAGLVEIEQDWGFNRDWAPTGWMAPDIWARVKLDAFIRESDSSAVCYDWKTGKKFGNEIKHSQQGLVYGLSAVLRYPEIEYIESTMVYLDKGELLTKKYTRDELLMIHFDKINVRANRMTTATDFPPKPSMSNCRWCAHAKVQEGNTEPACQWRWEG